MSDFRKRFLQPETERRAHTGRLDPGKMEPVGEREFEEAMLAHYDELGDVRNYKLVLERMRANGMEPRGAGRPLPGSPFYDHGR